MPNCPYCGTQTSNPVRTWVLAGRRDMSGFRLVLTIGLFNCPSCGRPFREIIDRRREPIDETADLTICPECGKPNSKNRDYCSQCGTLFHPEKFCHDH